MLIPTFREVQDEITSMLRQQGYLAAILVDLAPLAHIEKSFGGAAFRSLREQVDPLLQSMRENFRQDDFVTRDEREGDRFLLFLSGPRRGDTPFRSETLRKLVGRVEEYLNPRVGRLTLPYLKERPVLVAGYGVVLWSPLESPERQILRLVDDAATCALMRVRIRERDQRERLFEIIQNREIWTAFQPIVDLKDGSVLAWEGLSRGPRGSDVELPMVLFGQALRYGIGVGREGFTWNGTERISRMSEWPDWHPPSEMIDRQPYLPRFMAGGPGNPLGARALYLGKTLYRIHGTNQPSTIGTFVSSGCIRLINEDVEDLYSRVQVGTRVVVLPGRPAENVANGAPQSAANGAGPVPVGAPMNTAPPSTASVPRSYGNGITSSPLPPPGR